MARVLGDTTIFPDTILFPDDVLLPGVPGSNGGGGGDPGGGGGDPGGGGGDPGGGGGDPGGGGGDPDPGGGGTATPVLDICTSIIADLAEVRVEKEAALAVAVAGLSDHDKDVAAADIGFIDQAIREIRRAYNLIARLGV